jgi:FecR protein
MAEPRRDPDDGSVARLGALARAAIPAGVSTDAHAHGRDRLVETLAQPPPARPWWPVAAASAAAALALVLALAWPAPQLSYVVDDESAAGPAATSGYVSSGPAGATARFSEGTSVRFAPRAQGRIAGVTSHGARVEIAAGSASFHVVHRPSAEWSAEAGPFTITVTGTEFDVTWSSERLQVDLHRGSVVVRGPLVTDGVALHAGQTLLADVARGELTIRDAVVAMVGAEGTPQPPLSVTTVGAEGTPKPPLSVTTVGAEGPHKAPLVDPPAEPTAPPTWRSRVAGGDFGAVLAEADARGIEACLAAASLSDLAALADAARYAGRPALAQRALGAERARFPGSAEARSAAFLLGRMVDASQPAAAIGWYDRYLAESPGGSLADEALGRKMVAVARISGRDAARPVAEEYLRRFPGGAFAAAAADTVGGR